MMRGADLPEQAPQTRGRHVRTHRVIESPVGPLTGYAGGMARRQQLLALDDSRRAPGTLS